MPKESQEQYLFFNLGWSVSRRVEKAGAVIVILHTQQNMSLCI